MRHFFVAATLAAALPFAGLPSQFEKIAPAAKGRVGVAAQLLESGETASLHGDEHFPMHSVYKLPISMAVLQRVDRGELKLDQLVRVELSDFVRKGMSSPVRDKYPNVLLTFASQMSKVRHPLSPSRFQDSRTPPVTLPQEVARPPKGYKGCPYLAQPRSAISRSV